MPSRICFTFTSMVLAVALSHLGLACTPDSHAPTQPVKAKTSSSSSSKSLPPKQTILAPILAPKGTTQPATLGVMTGSAKQGGKLTREGDTFVVHLPESKNGASVALKIESKLGYKVNENFPHRAEFKVGSAQKITAQTKKEKHRLTFTTSESDISKIGTSVVLSFSICNDQMCKLYDETYQW